MSTIVVQDANIFIDLQIGQVLDNAFQMNCVFHTTDAVLDEVEDRLDDFADRGLLRVKVMSGDELLDVAILKSQQPRRISFEDCTLLKLADHLEAIVLTGDGNLRFCAESMGLEVRGTLWVLDNMVESHLISPKQAFVALNKMMSAGRRLPADECQIRLRRWA